jgi:hypothetical protein
MELKTEITFPPFRLEGIQKAAYRSQQGKGKSPSALSTVRSNYAAS